MLKDYGAENLDIFPEIEVLESNEHLEDTNTNDEINEFYKRIGVLKD